MGQNQNQRKEALGVGGYSLHHTNLRGNSGKFLHRRRQRKTGFSPGDIKTPDEGYLHRYGKKKRGPSQTMSARQVGHQRQLFQQ